MSWVEELHEMNWVVKVSLLVELTRFQAYPNQRRTY